MIKEYKDLTELVADLRKYDWQDWFLRKRREEAASDLAAIIRHSVAGNTFRAFQNLPAKPSEVFRRWAYQALANGFLDELVSLRSERGFNLWLRRLSASFRNRWQAKMGKQINYGPSRKLPNLLVKRLCLFREVPERSVKRLVWFLHVPLDNSSLVAIRNCTMLFPNRDAIGEIPRSATMSFVENERMYEALEEGIRMLCRQAQVPPIALDLMSWNAAHKSKD